MFLEAIEQLSVYCRLSKNGKVHSYNRRSVIYLFSCDNCFSKFTRPKSNVIKKRASNNYYHVCKECNSKKFAQSIGVKQRKILDMPVSSLKSLGDL